MPRSRRRRPPQRGTGQFSRFCMRPGCGELIAAALLMCPECWYKIPSHLKDALAKAQRRRDEQAVTAAADAITAYARHQSVAEQGAGAL